MESMGLLQCLKELSQQETSFFLDPQNIESIEQLEIELAMLGIETFVCVRAMLDKVILSFKYNETEIGHLLKMEIKGTIHLYYDKYVDHLNIERFVVSEHLSNTNEIVNLIRQKLLNIEV